MHATEPPADPRASFRGKCLDCHAELDCGVPREHSSRKTNGDDCVACHMPQTETDIPHIAFTHHRIGIHGGDRAPLPTDARQFSTLVPIQDVSHLAPELQDRCLGLGYLEYSARQSDPEARSESLRKARMLLEACVRRGAGDGDLLAGLARMAWEDRPGAALELAAQALAREDLSAGARLNAWFVLADLHFQSRRPREAAAALETLTRLRRHSEDWLLLGLSRRQLLQDDAVAALQQAAVISPFRPDIRQLMQQVAGRGNEATAPRQ
jgi:hypothetical protein